MWSSSWALVLKITKYLVNQNRRQQLSVNGCLCPESIKFKTKSIKISLWWLLWKSPLIIYLNCGKLICLSILFIKFSATQQFTRFYTLGICVNIRCCSYIGLSTRLVSNICGRVQGNPIYYLIFSGIWLKKDPYLYFPYSSLFEIFFHQPLNIFSG